MSIERNNEASGRALTARSVVLSVLLGTEPPRLPVHLLVRTAGLFGIAEGTTRTALSRMREAGEVVADDGWYALASERLLARRVRQEAGRHPATGPWEDRAWLQAAVVGPARRPAAERAALRAELATARLAELREGVWLRPDNLGERPQLPGSLGDGLAWFRVTPDEDGRVLAGRLWDLEAWAAAAEDLRRRMGHLVGPLREHDHSMLADGFVLSADVLRHLGADPLLPVELRPAGWPGDALREDYDLYDAAYRAVLREWFASIR